MRIDIVPSASPSLGIIISEAITTFHQSPKKRPHISCIMRLETIFLIRKTRKLLSKVQVSRLRRVRFFPRQSNFHDSWSPVLTFLNLPWLVFSKGPLCHQSYAVIMLSTLYDARIMMGPSMMPAYYWGPYFSSARTISSSHFPSNFSSLLGMLEMALSRSSP